MLRLIAMASMLIDHVGAAFFPEAIWLRIIGRAAFPLYAWGIASGYRRTRNWKLYAARLFITGCITQLPYAWLFKSGDLNVCFTLLAGLLLLKVLNGRNNPLKLIGSIALLALTHFLRFEYGLYGIFTILVFYFYQKDRKLPLYQGVLTLLGMLVYSFHYIQIFSIISSWLVLNVKDDRLRLPRLIQYGFYPVHIVILLILREFAGM